jgi:hypothetical protein
VLRCPVTEMRSGLNDLNCEAKRRWSGISGDYDAELWVIGVLSLRATPRVQNSIISVRAGGGIPGEVYVTRSPVSPTDRTQHNNSERNINNHLDVSVLPHFRSTYDPFNVRESILARPHTGRSRHLGPRHERKIIRPVIPIISYVIIGRLILT